MDKEQIEKAAKEYRMSLPYCDDPKIRGISIGGYDGFIKGAQWRINSVWHDAKEEPKQNEWFIAQIGDDCFDTFVMQVESERWVRWCKGMNIKRWAYVEDLVPTGI